MPTARKIEGLHNSYRFSDDNTNILCGIYHFVLIKYNVDDQLLRQKIEEMVNSGKYSNIDALLERALRNLVADENSGMDNESFWAIFPIEPIDYEKVGEEYAKGHYININNSNIIEGDELPYGILSRGLISHWHNRLLPMKWLLRQFLRFTKESNSKWFDIREFEDYILNKALPQIESSISNLPNVSRAYVAVGFPKIEKMLEQEKDSHFKQQKMRRAIIIARARFFTQYFGQIIQKKASVRNVPKKNFQERKNEVRIKNFRSKGACFEMGFFACKYSLIEDQKEERKDDNSRSPKRQTKFTFEIALTPLGLKFAKMVNPLLDAFEKNDPIAQITKELVNEYNEIQTVISIFTQEETKFILDNIYTQQNKDISKNRYKLENEIIKKILGKEPILKYGGIPITRTDYHELFNEIAKEFNNLSNEKLKLARLTQHKSSTIMRLVELGLVYKAGREIYVIQPH